MTDIIWPDDLVSVTCSFYLQSHSAMSQSPFTRQRQVYGLSAPRFVVNATFHGSDADHGARLDALLATIKGPQSRVWLHDWRRSGNAVIGPSLSEFLAPYVGQTFAFSLGETFSLGEVWTFSATGQIANQATPAGASSMKFTGFGYNVPTFRVGWYLGGDNRAHLITKVSNSNANGECEVFFEPPLQAAVSAGFASTEKVRSPFRLVSDDAGLNPTDVSHFSQYDLSFEEDL